MKLTIDNFTIKFNQETSDLISDWTWLIGTDKKPILITAIGDMFLMDTSEGIYWLDVGRGKLECVASNITDFKNKLKDIEQVNEWFMIDLTTKLKCSSKKLNDGQLYSYKKLPILGGDYSINNFEPTDIEVHFSFAGQIHNQIKDLPDGTRINKVELE